MHENGAFNLEETPAVRLVRRFFGSGFKMVKEPYDFLKKERKKKHETGHAVSFQFVYPFIHLYIHTY